ncbi:MAG: MptD family putative ECF transporter S component [Eubacteriales bacterium]
MNTKLDTKDLIYAGAFTAIYLLIRFVVVMTLGLIPVLYITLPFFTGIACATIYMMYVMKIQKPKAIFILASLFGISLLVTGHFISVFLCIPIGLLAELVAKMGKYQSLKMYSFSFLVFNFTMVTPFGQLYLSRELFVEGVRSSYGDDYAQMLSGILETLGGGLLLIQCTCAVLGAVIGVLVGNLLFKKHFKKAGIV